MGFQQENQGHPSPSLRKASSLSLHPIPQAEQHRSLAGACDEVQQTFPLSGTSADRAFRGLFFEVLAATTISIQTLEVDLRFTAGNGLPVKVYVSDSRVVDVHNNANSWTLVSDSLIASSPLGAGEGGGVIPAYDFQTVVVSANQRKSFYILLNAPNLDFKIDIALNTPNILAVAGNDFSVFTGWHLEQSDAEFPAILREDLAPIFGGRFHYRQNGCNTNQVVTTDTNVIMSFVIDYTLTQAEFDDVNDALETQFANLLLSDPTLTSMANSANLQLASGGISTVVPNKAETCPDSFSFCVPLEVTVPIQHGDQLTQGQVRQALYQHIDDFENAAVSVLRDGAQIDYVGLLPANHCFRISMTGINDAGSTMDSVQTDYFEERVIDVPNREIPSGIAQVFSLDIVSQEFSRTTTFDVVAVANGAIYAKEGGEDYKVRVQTALNQNKEDLIADFKYYQKFPGPMAQSGRYTFFDGIDLLNVIDFPDCGNTPTSAPTVTAQPSNRPKVTPGAPTRPPSNEPMQTGDDGLDLRLLMYAGIGLGGIVILCLMGFCCKKMMDQRDRSKDKAIDKLEAQNSSKLVIDASRQMTLNGRDEENGRRDSEFQDEHDSFDGSTINTNSFRLSKKSNSKPSPFSFFGAARKPNRRASTGMVDSDDEEFNVSDKPITKKRAGRRASTGMVDSDDEDFGDFAARRPPKAKSFAGEEHAKENAKRRASTGLMPTARDARDSYRKRSGSARSLGRRSGSSGDLGKKRQGSMGKVEEESFRTSGRNHGNLGHLADLEMSSERKRDFQRRHSTGSSDGGEDDIVPDLAKSVRKSTASRRRYSTGRLEEDAVSSKPSKSKRRQSKKDGSSQHSKSTRQSSRRLSSTKKQYEDESESAYSFAMTSDQDSGSDEESATETSRGMDDFNSSFVSKSSKKSSKKSKKKKKKKKSSKSEKANNEPPGDVVH